MGVLTEGEGGHRVTPTPIGHVFFIKKPRKYILPIIKIVLNIVFFSKIVIIKNNINQRGVGPEPPHIFF